MKANKGIDLIEQMIKELKENKEHRPDFIDYEYEGEWFRITRI